MHKASSALNYWVDQKLVWVFLYHLTPTNKYLGGNYMYYILNLGYEWKGVEVLFLKLLIKCLEAVKDCTFCFCISKFSSLTPFHFFTSMGFFFLLLLLFSLLLFVRNKMVRNNIRKAKHIHFTIQLQGNLDNEEAFL